MLPLTKDKNTCNFLITFWENLSFPAFPSTSFFDHKSNLDSDNPHSDSTSAAVVIFFQHHSGQHHWYDFLYIHSLFSIPNQCNLSPQNLFSPSNILLHVRKRRKKRNYKRIVHKAASKMVGYHQLLLEKKPKIRASVAKPRYSSDVLLTKLKYSWLFCICLHRSTLLWSLE